MKTQILLLISIALLFSCKPSTSNYGDHYEVIVKAVLTPNGKQLGCYL